jgi:hypothetical protein
MAPPALEPTPLAVSAAVRPERVQVFYRHCATCHLGASRTPPNFLAGDDAQVDRQLAQCAPRIHVRLAMWQAQGAARAKMPMPPPMALRGMHVSESAWRDSAELARLRTQVDALIQADTGRAPDTAALLAAGYETLPTCLPEKKR